MFTKACVLNELKEGKTDVAAVERTLVLLVWPQGGNPWLIRACVRTPMNL